MFKQIKLFVKYFAKLGSESLIICIWCLPCTACHIQVLIDVAWQVMFVLADKHIISL